MNENIDEQWEQIFSSTAPYRVEILKALLEEEGIISVVINKQDSSYLIFGEVELYVKRKNILQAKLITGKFLEHE